jgi:hypothetical protein
MCYRNGIYVLASVGRDEGDKCRPYLEAVDKQQHNKVILNAVSETVLFMNDSKLEIILTVSNLIHILLFQDRCTNRMWQIKFSCG